MSNEKLTIKQHIGLIMRGLKIWKAHPQPVFLSSALSALFEGLVPFINIYFSAMILNELASARDREQLIFLVSLTVGFNLVGFLIQKALSRWSAYCSSYAHESVYKIYTDKALSLDYADAENPAVQGSYSQIHQHHTGMGFGLMMLTRPIPQIIQGIARIALSVAMVFTMFTFRVPAGSVYGWLDSPWAIAAVLLLLAGPMLLTPYLNMAGGKIWAAASNENNKYNRFFAYYYYHMIQGSDTAKDIRIYNQKHIAGKHTEGFHNRGVGSWSKYNGRFVASGTAVAYLCNGLIYLYIALKALAGLNSVYAL